VNEGGPNTPPTAPLVLATNSSPKIVPSPAPLTVTDPWPITRIKPSYSILPLIVKGARTTKALRATDFEIVIATGGDGKAEGSLYVDDGVSLTPASSTNLKFEYAQSVLTVSGSFGYPLGVKLAGVSILGVGSSPTDVVFNGKSLGDSWAYDAGKKAVDVDLGVPFEDCFTLELKN